MPESITATPIPAPVSPPKLPLPSLPAHNWFAPVDWVVTAMVLTTTSSPESAATLASLASRSN